MELWTLIALAIALTPGVRWLIDRVVDLHWTRAFRRSVAVEALRDPKRFGLLFLLTFPALVLPAWSAFEAGWIAQLLIGVAGGVMLLQGITGPFNRYTGRWYAFDRVAYIVTLGLAILHPAAVAPLLLLAVLPRHVVGLTFPTGKAPTDGRFPFDALHGAAGLVWAAGVLTLLGWEMPLWTLPVAMLGMFAIIAGVWYAYAGFVKGSVSVNPPHWWERFDLGELFACARELGHASWLSQNSSIRVQRMLKKLSPSLSALVILIEAAGVLVLASPTTGAVVLGLLICMHIAILATCAIFFWKWIALDLAIIACFFTLPAEASATLFGVPGLAFTVAALVSARSWLRADGLVWLSSPLKERFTVEVELAGGRVAELPPQRLAPYDLEFIQSRLGFATEAPMLTDTFGMVDLDTERQDAIRAAEPEDMKEIYERLGQVRYMPDWARWVGDLVECIADDMSKHRRGLIGRWRGFTLTHFMVFPKTESFDPADIEAVRIRRRSFLLNKERREVVVDDIVLRREIGSQSTGAPKPLEHAPNIPGHPKAA